MKARHRGKSDHVCDEPQFRTPVPATCSRCGYALGGLAAGSNLCPECGERFADDRGNPSPGNEVEHSPWDEPAIRASGAEAPEGARTWARWFEEKKRSMTASESCAWTALVGLAAGPWAVLGAFLGAGSLTSGLLTAVVVGPIVEELMKVAAASVVIEKRPWVFRSTAQVLGCCGMGGLAFAVIENLLYLNIYIPQPDAGIIIWRWTVCVFLHLGCALIAGLGLARVWRDVSAQRRPAELADAFRYMVIAIVVHGSYNALATVLEWTQFV
ncbi:MAG: PrsW family intramembrane metalloprotease [Phycisphaerales bacterium]|nr:PrsW family intramembrane metalloprotease [Phycisphaerales bacterium]